MTKKIYRSAMGKTVDIGALILQNESVRAVGNMNVNARGDVLNSQNQVVDQKSRQIQRSQRRQQTNVTRQPTYTGTVDARKAQSVQSTVESVDLDQYPDLPEDNDVVASTVTANSSSDAELRGGLAGAIARSRLVKQEKEKTPRQLQQEAGIKKL